MKLLSVAAGLWALLLAGLLLPVATSRAAPSFIYTSPRPGAILVSPGTTVTVRYAHLVDPSTLSPAAFDVRGAQSGAHAGDVTLAGDGRTVIFTPHAPFALGEQVTAAIGDLRTPGGAPLAGGDLTFTIAAHPVPFDPGVPPTALQPLLDGADTQAPPPAAPRAATADYATVPVPLPTISVTTPASGTADGYLFLTHFTIQWSPFRFVPTPALLLMVDDQGEPVYYRTFPSGGVADFKRQAGDKLTYARSGHGLYVLDQTYTEVATYTTGNGYLPDLHDFQLRPDGRALVMSYDPQQVDMSQIVDGGDPDATVVGLIIQELDADNNVLFQWRSWDHIPITDTNQSLTSPRIDYIHGNSVGWDHDGNILISSRHIDEITKIDRETGDVIWRLGGKGNQFTFLDEDGEPFFYQHDARRLPNGHLTLFDNRTGPESTYARGVEYELDEAAMTARRVWEHRNTGGVPSLAMGNMQRLPNGNSLIGWGALTTTLTEVTPDGQTAFELQMPTGDPHVIGVSYRAFRFPWEGAPLTRPRLVARTEMTETAVYYSWNGATNVEAWLLYAGSAPGDLDLVDARPRDGFETRSAVADPDLCFFRVEALDAQGAVLESSALTIAEHCVARRLFLPAVTE